MIQIAHLPAGRNVHRVDGVAAVSLTAYVDVYLITYRHPCRRGGLVAAQKAGSASSLAKAAASRPPVQPQQRSSSAPLAVNHPGHLSLMEAEREDPKVYSVIFEVPRGVEPRSP